MERLYSIEEAAKLLGGLSPLTIVGWCAKGKLKRTKVGRRTMLSEGTLVQFLKEQNPQTPQPEAA